MATDHRRNVLGVLPSTGSLRKHFPLPQGMMRPRHRKPPCSTVLSTNKNLSNKPCDAYLSSLSRFRIESAHNVVCAWEIRDEIYQSQGCVWIFGEAVPSVVGG
jgi:hypothetical protein